MARLARPSNRPSSGWLLAQLHVGLRWAAPAVCRSESARPAGFIMLLTRRVCYGLLAAQHLADHAGEGSVSANDLSEFCGLPHEALAKILQRRILPDAAVLAAIGQFPYQRLSGN